MTDEINTRKYEVDSKERIAAMQTEAQLVIAEAKIRGDAAMAVLNAQITDVQRRLEALTQPTEAPVSSLALPEGQEGSNPPPVSVV